LSPSSAETRSVPPRPSLAIYPELRSRIVGPDAPDGDTTDTTAG
jgi:hypothetical protein